ncbi:MAG: hypothetical protein ABI686_09410 [Acidobacteriota bacterium]
MTHSIVLEVPENIYQGIVKEAESKKRKVEEIALERLAKDTPHGIEDPLDEFVGAFRSDVPDWADNHDKYLGENLMRELRGENE